MNTTTNIDGIEQTPGEWLSAQAAARGTDAKLLPAIDATIIRDADGMAEGLKLVFGDGAEITIDCASLAPVIQYEAQVHGLKQKLVDAAALPRSTVTGKSATVEDKKAAVLEVFARLTDTDNPRWNKGRAEGAGGSQEGGLLARAMAEVTGKPVTEAKAWLADRSKEEQAALRMNPKVKAIIDRMRAEADKPMMAGIDSDALLNMAMGG